MSVVETIAQPEVANRAPAAVPHVVIRPTSGFAALNLAEIWRYQGFRRAV